MPPARGPPNLATRMTPRVSRGVLLLAGRKAKFCGVLLWMLVSNISKFFTACCFSPSGLFGGVLLWVLVSNLICFKSVCSLEDLARSCDSFAMPAARVCQPTRPALHQPLGGALALSPALRRVAFELAERPSQLSSLSRRVAFI